MTDSAPSVAPQALWRPSADRVARAGVTRFIAWLRETRGLEFDGYEALWRWSVEHLEDFWAAFWDFAKIRSHTPWKQVLARREMPGAKWFEGATLNFAEHMLAHAPAQQAAGRPAIIFRSELVARREISWADLSGHAASLSAQLRALGIGRGDRVVGYLPNIPESVEALLAVSSVGAIWSGSSPDMGPVSVLDRFRQIEPRVLFAVDGYRYGGRDFDRRDVVRELVAQLPSVEAVIFLPYLDPLATLELPEGGRDVKVLPYHEVLAQPATLQFEAVPFDHPLWIVYSSGTTGMPKPIVHGHGGSILENLKSGLLHSDITPEDRFFWFSSTNWIMWNLLVSTLMTGATIVQFDGNPGAPDLDTLWRMAAEERITFFGTSPAFIGLNMKAGQKPGTKFDLSALRSVGSTGSPLTEEGYRWVYECVNPDVMLACISGGTDPGTSFLSSCPTLPVYPGEMQVRGLGCDLRAWNDAGQDVMDEVGELVCAQPMPSFPLYFWNDAGGRRYFESYFEHFPGPPNVWRHGDWLRLIPRAESVTGVIYGRSDSTINRHGIRMGTSELYRVVEEFDEIADSLVVDLEYLGRESYMALFVVLRDPAAPQAVGVKGPALEGETAGRAAEKKGADTGVAPELRQRLLEALRTKLSARHVPNDVFAIPEVPRTISGKKMEVPIKKILLGQPAEKSANRDAMGNPGSLDWFVAFARGRAAH